MSPYIDKYRANLRIRNTFVIPKILFDSSLVLSPQIFYLGLMFHNNVFSVPVTPENIFYLNIRPKYNQLILPQKPEKAEDYVLDHQEATQRLHS
jgi:hypothetical protein